MPERNDIETRIRALDRVYDDPNGLAYKLVTTADWRLRTADKYPEDERNLEAAAELTSLAEWIVSEKAAPLVARYDAMWERKLAREDDLSDLCQAEDEKLKDIGFRASYKSGEDFLRAMILDEEPPPLRVVSGYGKLRGVTPAGHD